MEQHAWCPKVKQLKEVNSADEANGLIRDGWVALVICHEGERLKVVLGAIDEAKVDIGQLFVKAEKAMDRVNEIEQRPVGMESA